MARFKVWLPSVFLFCFFSGEANSMLLSKLAAKTRNSSARTATRHKFKFKTLKAQDPARQLMKAIETGDMLRVLQLAPHAGVIFPNGSNAVLDAARYLPSCQKKPALRMLIEHGAFFNLPHLVDLHIPQEISEELRELCQASKNIDGLSTVYPYMNMQFYTLSVAVQSLLTKSEHETIEEFVDIFKNIRDQSDSEVARHNFTKLFSNGVNASTALLHSFFFKPNLSEEQLAIITEKFGAENYQAIPANILRGLGLIDNQDREADLIAQATRRVKLLAPEFIIKVAHVTKALMNHEEVELFKEHPEHAHFLQVRNFSDKPFNQLPFPEQRYKAYRIIKKEVDRAQKKKTEL